MRYQTGRNLVREPARKPPNRRVATVTDIGVEYAAPDRSRRGRRTAIAALVVVAAVIALVLVVLG